MSELTPNSDRIPAENEGDVLGGDSVSSVPIDPQSIPQELICPLTQELMTDPVEIESGYTFERAAIQKRFDEGSTTCPVSGKPIQNSELKPNLAIAQEIVDFKARNIVLHIKSTRPKLESVREEETEAGLLEIFKLCEDNPQNRYWIAAEGLIPPIVNILKSTRRNLRRKALATLCALSTNNNENREAMADAGAILLAVRSLSRDVGESRQGVALLLELSKSPRVCEDIGKAPSSILLLVTMLNSENKNAANDARLVLEQLASNDQNVVQMAEANHFSPLTQRLTTGSAMTKTVMASALSRMTLTDQSKLTLAQEGAIPPLVSIITSGKLESKAAALGALENLSTLPANRDVIVKSGAIPPLLQLLFSVTSVVMSLKEGAGSTLANLTMAGIRTHTQIDSSGAILESEETIFQLLSLVNLSGPLMQTHLLRALLGMALIPDAIEVRNRMRTGGAISILVPFLECPDQPVRTNAAQLLKVLARDDGGKEVAENLREGQNNGLKAIVKMLDEKESPDDRASAAFIISLLPLQDSSLTNSLVQLNALPAIVGLLSSKNNAAPLKESLMEAASAALIRFTLPSDTKLQGEVADLGSIPLLTNLLVTGSSLSRKNACLSLANFSHSSPLLSQPGKSSSGGCFCFSKPPLALCDIHQGVCTVDTSFCLLEAEAITPLVNTLSDKDPETCEAALVALSTLMADDVRWESGVAEIYRAGGIMRIAQLLSEGTDRAKEKGAWVIEKVLRVEKHRYEFGALVQSAVIQLAQNGTNETKPIAAKILNHLNLLHNQSSYF